MIRPSLLASLIVLACTAACHEGNAVSNGAADMTASDDLAIGEPDLATPDLRPSRSCGQIVLCIAQCGFTNTTCDQMCVVGSPPQELLKAVGLTLCAVQNCLGDGGVAASDPVGLFGCLSQKCPQQVSGCDGLPGGH